jgi:RND family efflux transporter MFP subunit
MQMNRYIYIGLLALALSSCGNGDDSSLESKNLKVLREAKANLSKQQSGIHNQIKEIEAEIEKLDDSRKIDLVSTRIMHAENFEHYLEVQGNIETKKNVLIYPETSGLLQRVFVKKGDRVEEGQLLASIDDGGFLEQISQAEIQRDLAKTTFERQAELWAQRIGSEIQYLQAKTNYEAQEKLLDQLNERFSKTQIKAPFSGIIDDIIKEQGTIVSPGPNSEIFRIVCLQDMYVKAEIPENNLPNIKVGTKVEVYIPVLNKSIQSKIRQVSNHINPENRSFEIEIGIPNEQGSIKPNLTARLKINDYTNTQALMIPQSAISEDGENHKFVFLAKKESGKTIAVKQKVVTGKSKGDLIEIVSGLSVDDQAIIDGGRKVKKGQEIRILPN